jgi:hypothetical protein
MNARHVLIVTLLLGNLAQAQVPAVCDQPRAVDKYQLLRRLSLDLRGHMPSYEEFTALDSQSTVPDTTIASWLASDDFRAVARRYHEDLFWPNVSNTVITSTSTQLVSVGTPAALAIASVTKRRVFRGAPDVTTTTLGKQCGDFEQTHFVGTTFAPDPAFVRTSVVNTVTVKQEGWRMVAPYWAPTTRVKVCAYDAMETTSVTVASKVIGCNTPASDARPECGCGPGLRFCYGPAAATRDVMLAAMREQLLRQVDRVSTGGRPYTELLTSRHIEVNGPLAFWKRNLATHYSLARLYVDLDPNETVPNLEFGDASDLADRRPRQRPARRCADCARLPAALSDQSWSWQSLPHRLRVRVLRSAFFARDARSGVQRYRHRSDEALHLQVLPPHARAAGVALGAVLRGRHDVDDECD